MPPLYRRTVTPGLAGSAPTRARVTRCSPGFVHPFRQPDERAESARENARRAHPQPAPSPYPSDETYSPSRRSRAAYARIARRKSTFRKSGQYASQK